jgi:hypothetical protein
MSWILHQHLGLDYYWFLISMVLGPYIDCV